MYNNKIVIRTQEIQKYFERKKNRIFSLSVEFNCIEHDVTTFNNNNNNKKQFYKNNNYNKNSKLITNKNQNEILKINSKIIKNQ